MTPHRAYMILNVKEITEGRDFYTIKGIATTPTVDRQGDIVEPMGARFTLPIKLLWQHDAKKPIGNVTFAKPTKDGIPYEAQIPNVKEPGALKDRIDEAIQSIKYKLVAAVSIGFQPIEGMVETLKSGGLHFLEWLWLELSLVTIPAQEEATIQTIKSIDQAQQRSASGAAPVVRLDPSPPGASGSQTKPASSRFFYDPSKGKNMKTYREQIEGFEAKRAANVGRQQELVQKAADEGRTFDPSEKEEYAALKSDVSAIDEQLVVLREMELTSKQTAQTVSGSTADISAEQAKGGAAGNGKNGTVVMGKSNLPKGTGFVRLAMLTMASNGDDQKALNMAKRFRDSTPEVENIFRAKIEGLELKAAVAAGTTTDATWAAPLVQYQQLASEFVELLRPETVLGKIGGFRRVPFNVRIPSQSTGVSAGWVGQGAPKPVGKPGFTSATMDFYKIAIIVAMTEELVRFSNPAAEGLVRSDMINAIAQFMDEQFLSPGVAAVAGVSPASITFGLTPVQSSGVTVAAITADMKALFAKFTAANISLDGITLIMHPNNALSLAMARTSQDVPAFPGMSIAGGGFLGVTVITSASVPSSTSGGSMVIALKPSEIFLADDGQVTIDMSREASVQMDSAPAAGAQSLTSFWQNNLVGLRAERYINYARRRTGAVAYIDNVGW